MRYTIERYQELANSKSKENKDFLAKLRKRKPKDLDAVTKQAHNDSFEDIDCLECANCCKSISPIVKERDIQKIAKYLKRGVTDVAQEYFELDTDGTYIFKETPCPFLMPDNYCMVYEARPRACAEYPHTDRKKFFQLLNLTYKNTFVCPAALTVVENLKEEYK